MKLLKLRKKDSLKDFSNKNKEPQCSLFFLITDAYEELANNTSREAFTVDRYQQSNGIYLLSSITNFIGYKYINGDVNFLITMTSNLSGSSPNIDYQIVINFPAPVSKRTMDIYNVTKDIYYPDSYISTSGTLMIHFYVYSQISANDILVIYQTTYNIFD